MDKVFQVFVSSTFSDLEDERRQVTNTLAKAGYIAAGMELFPATDQQQLDFIKRVIDRSDYYVVIVAGRYGSLADDQLSYTEHEFEYARSKGIPVLAFLHGDTNKIEVGKTDRDPNQALRLQSFRQKLATGRLVDFWTHPQDLSTKVLTAIVQTTNLFPGTGWVRGDQTIEPKTIQQLERLRDENEALKKQLLGADATGISFPSHLAELDDVFEFTIVGTDSRNAESENTELYASLTFRKIFEIVSELLINDGPEATIGRILAESFMQHFGITVDKSKLHSVSAEHLKVLRFHFEALGLIQATLRTEIVGSGSFEFKNEYIAWQITGKGRNFIANLWAVQKQPK